MELLFVSDMRHLSPEMGGAVMALNGPITLTPLFWGVMLPSAALGEREKAQTGSWRAYMIEAHHSLLHRFAMFNKVRIPRQNLLDRTGNITSEGTYNSPFKVPVGCGHSQTELSTCLLLWC